MNALILAQQQLIKEQQRQLEEKDDLLEKFKYKANFSYSGCKNINCWRLISSASGFDFACWECGFYYCSECRASQGFLFDCVVCGQNWACLKCCEDNFEDCIQCRD